MIELLTITAIYNGVNYIYMFVYFKASVHVYIELAKKINYIRKMEKKHKILKKSLNTYKNIESVNDFVINANIIRNNLPKHKISNKNKKKHNDNNIKKRKMWRLYRYVMSYLENRAIRREEQKQKKRDKIRLLISAKNRREKKEQELLKEKEGEQKGILKCSKCKHYVNSEKILTDINAMSQKIITVSKPAEANKLASLINSKEPVNLYELEEYEDILNCCDLKCRNCKRDFISNLYMYDVNSCESIIYLQEKRKNTPKNEVQDFEKDVQCV